MALWRLRSNLSFMRYRLWGKVINLSPQILTELGEAVVSGPSALLRSLNRARVHRVTPDGRRGGYIEHGTRA